MKQGLLTFESFIDQLKAPQERGSQPLLVAIDGKSGVGKSTFAQRLSRRFNAALVCGDDFYAGGTELLQVSPEQLVEICIDRARLGSVLQQLKSRRTAQHWPFDWTAFDGSLAKKPITIEPAAIMILEGVYSNHPDIRQWIDCSVLLRVPEAERERRLLAREGEITAWERQWHRAEDWYFEHLARLEHFSFVLDDDG